MPTLFQGVCSNCGHKTAIMTGGYGAVLVDHPAAHDQPEVVGTAIMSGTKGVIAATSDPRFVVLSHPAESAALAATGYRWADLLSQGRYVCVTNVICGQCGAIFSRRRLEAPGGTGCLTALVFGLTSGVAAGIWRRQFLVGLGVGYAATLCVLGLFGFGAQLYVRRRFAARAASLAAERSCPNCQADDARRIDGAKSVRCPACRAESLTFVIVGKS